MRVLLIGSGAREHALAWKIGQSPHLEKLYCWPGNPGTAELGENIEGDFKNPDKLGYWAREQKIDLTIFGPEAPLVDGLADSFSRRGLFALGPGREGARLEGSKSWAKKVMDEAGVPTAGYDVAVTMEQVEKSLAKYPEPYVLKVDGLAAGKGVLICEDHSKALEEARSVLEENRFGSAGQKLVIEEFLQGKEASLLAICAGGEYLLFAPSRDHKRLKTGDQGPNTGGMGAYSPIEEISAAEQDELGRQIFRPILDILQKKGIDYRGILYAGLMLTPQGPKVLEFNVRFGDPETQAILPRMENDLLPYLFSAARGELFPEPIKWKEEACLCVNLVSGGYPGSYKKGYPISGLEKLNPETIVFQGGTSTKDNQLVTAGGRVLGVTVLGKDLSQAREKAYLEVEKVNFKDKYYRTDLGRF